jgi:RNA polymerase sigma-70 factor (ECF subfamily)
MEELIEPATIAHQEGLLPLSTHINQGYTFDQHYLDRLAQGDPEVQLHFTSHFGKLLTLKLKFRLRSKELVEDARQETFLRVLHILRNKGGIKDPQRLGAFVNAVCDNVLLEFFRAGAAYPRPLGWSDEPPSTYISAESEIISAQQKAFLRKRLSELSSSDQKILRRVFLEELDKDQICAEMGISRENLRVRVHRVLRRFRNALIAPSEDQGRSLERLFSVS